MTTKVKTTSVDRWLYNRWGYDRWGYDHWGYNWAGYNWAGYDRNGWDRDGRNDLGQRRDHPGDPRNQDWYNRHHPYEQYYQWKFQNDDQVYHRTQWDQAHGFNPTLYQNRNMSRDWHDPRNRDWAPLATASTATKSVTDVNIHASSPVANLNASLAQFISNDKATSNTGSLMKDLADKSARDFTNELNPRTTISIWSPPASTLGTPPQQTTKHPWHHRHLRRPHRPRRRRRCLGPPHRGRSCPHRSMPVASSSEPPTSVGLACRPVGAWRRQLVKQLDFTRGGPGTQPAERGVGVMATTRSSWRTCVKLDPTQAATMVLPIRVGGVVIMDHNPVRR